MKSVEREVVRELVVRAPQLLPLARLLFRERTNPEDRRAHIQLELMRHHDLDRCPSCDTQLSASGYKRTHTAFFERETLTCGGCQTTFVLAEESCA